MTDPIDLNAHRDAKEGPDTDYVTKDEYGRSLYTFLLHYEMDGATYGTQILAYDEADADLRIEAMRNSLRYVGKVYRRIPG